MHRRRMEKPAWSLSRLYGRCFLILAAIGLWWLLFVFHFSLVAHEVSSDSPVATLTEVPPLLHSRQNLGTLQSNLSEDPPQRATEESQLGREKPPSLQPFWRALASIKNHSDPCAGKYVYMHDLPAEFNQDLLDNCKQLNPWANMCKYTENAGLGPELEDFEGSLPKKGWFATNQFAVDLIFHNRMKQYECLTSDSGKAAVLYVPFYAGLDIARHLWGANVSVRDAEPLRLASWLRSRPEWAIMGGRDHFMVGGRITWDFRRLTDDNKDWGNKLLYISEVMNMSMLMVERSPYHINDFGIPYPTYFHPSRDLDVKEWQEHVRAIVRPFLFSFAGAPRPELATSIRGQIMDQCKLSNHCNLLECDRGESKCHVPAVVMKLFQESVFCLQPQGDSYTRRSIFDSMIAGCIPVFFNNHSAYTQYVWHLPENYSSYSVFIQEEDVRAGNLSIEDILLKLSQTEIQSMREEVIRLIPGLVYNDPRHRLTKFKDAFDLTVQALIKKVTSLRVRITEGKDDFTQLAGQDAEDIRETDLKLSQREVRQWEGERRNGEIDTLSKQQ
ncbi:hypothetical protein L7F22_017253 [Adiantum nelumboides]|nr:hypothetical protein [Adiantum nelumboides]